jgi:hypothetical protein
MTDNGIQLKSPRKLDDWLMQQDQACFPSFDTQAGQKLYPDRYADFACALLPIHNNVEKGAMVAGALEWMKTTQRIAEESNDDERSKLLDKLDESDPIVHLNNHGKGHVDKVIQKVSEILHLFERGHLTPYEGFFLLCAIQLHDTGNVFGRNNHESECQQILEEKGKPFIPDSFERNVIKKLALVHGGTFDEDRDTIGRLASKKRLFEQYIRKTLLAALLRFGDELADDHSRADIEGLNQGSIIDGGIIYHRYSEALHTVQFERNSENEGIELYLCYEFDSNIASQTFNKKGRQTYLLDEIYDRTLKMERERRYCMRYLRPCFSLDRIKVEIVIQNSDHQKSYLTDKIRYTLEEKGYPNDPASGKIKTFGSKIRTGEEELNYMKEQWRVIP